MRAPVIHNGVRRRTCNSRRAMDDALYPRFARWLDFLIVLAVGMWCL
ncbi:MAG TPA: hypothetical protein VJ748_05415 [Vitreimonas sp.]|nr:hypothetical protein [Vitreimonas sp.]